MSCYTEIEAYTSTLVPMQAMYHSRYFRRCNAEMHGKLACIEYHDGRSGATVPFGAASKVRHPQSCFNDEVLSGI